MENNTKIFVIESLQEGDKKTGTNLYNDLIIYQFPFDSMHYKVMDSGDWYGAIEDIKSKVKPDDVVFLHLEAHGNGKGTAIILTNGEELSFRKIGDDFICINRIIGCNLYVTLAVCHGLFLLMDSMSLEKMPFCGLIGSLQAISESDLEIRYYEFYRSYSEFQDIELAMEELKKSNPSVPSSYIFLKPETIFFQTWKEYYEVTSDEEWKKKRSHIVAKRHHLNRKQRRAYLKKFNNENQIYAKRVFKQKSEEFFMLKEFPENKTRFGVDYSYYYNHEGDVLMNKGKEDKE